MMKKILSVCAAVLMLLPLAACRKQTPSQDQVRAICELSVMDCYYHNVESSIRKKYRVFCGGRKTDDFGLSMTAL